MASSLSSRQKRSRVISDLAEVATFNPDGSPRNRVDADLWELDFAGHPPLRLYFAKLSDSRSKFAKQNAAFGKYAMRIVVQRSKRRTSFSYVKSMWYVVNRLCNVANSAGCNLWLLGANPSAFKVILRSFDSSSTLYRVGALSSLLAVQAPEEQFVLLSDSQHRSLNKKAKKLRTLVGQTAYIPERLHNQFIADCTSLIRSFVAVATDFSRLSKAVAKDLKRPAWHRETFPNRCLRFPTVVRLLGECGIEGQSPQVLLALLHQVRSACFALIANYSIARKSEIKRLTGVSLTEVQDPILGVIYLLSSGTKKTQNNPNALWICSPLIREPIECLGLINKLAIAGVSEKALLFASIPRVYGAGSTSSHLPSSSVPKFRFGFLKRPVYQITEQDLDEARQLTPTLPEKKFALGRTWPFTQYQFRRTMIVRCAASGLVSPQSIAFQAKHRLLEMTWHYMTYFWKLARPDQAAKLLNLDADATKEFAGAYVDAYNESLVKLRTDRAFKSPYGEGFKERMLSSIPALSLSEFLSGESMGTVKKNFVGACCSKDYCSRLGSNSARGCLTKNDGRACVSALLHEDRIESIEGAMRDAQNEIDILGTQSKYDHRRKILLEDIEYGRKAISLIRESSGG